MVKGMHYEFHGRALSWVIIQHGLDKFKEFRYTKPSKLFTMDEAEDIESIYCTHLACTQDENCQCPHIDFIGVVKRIMSAFRRQFCSSSSRHSGITLIEPATEFKVYIGIVALVVSEQISYRDIEMGYLVLVHKETMLSDVYINPRRKHKSITNLLQCIGVRRKEIIVDSTERH